MIAPSLKCWPTKGNAMRVVDVEVYEASEVGPNRWPQARYLVHGHDDVLWTNDLAAAIEYVASELAM